MFTKQREEQPQDYFELFWHRSSLCATYSAEGLAQSVVTRLRAGKPRNFRLNPSRSCKRFFSYSTASRLAQSTTQPSIQREQRTMSSMLKDTETVYDHTTAPHAEIKNEWSYTSGWRAEGRFYRRATYRTEQNKDKDVLSERRNGRQAQVWVTSIAATVRRSCTNTAPA